MRQLWTESLMIRTAWLAARLRPEIPQRGRNAHVWGPVPHQGALAIIIVRSGSARDELEKVYYSGGGCRLGLCGVSPNKCAESIAGNCIIYMSNMSINNNNISKGTAELSDKITNFSKHL